MSKEEMVQELRALQAEHVKRLASHKTSQDRAHGAYSEGWWDGVVDEAERVLWRLNNLLAKVGEK